MADDTTKTIRIVVDASAAIDGSRKATQAFERMEKAQADTTSALDRMEKSLGRVGGYLKAQLALMAADVGARFVQMAKDALAFAAGLDELAEQLGITAGGFQALQFSAVQSGVKLEQLETGIGKFSVRMGEAAEGSKDVIEALDRLGVKNLDLAGKLRPTEDLLVDVARSIVAIEDPAKRAAAAVDFFGKSGIRMLPMLKDIAGGFDEMTRKARDAGAYIERDTIIKLDKLADSAEKAGVKLRAMFANTAAGPLTELFEATRKELEALDEAFSKLDRWGRSNSISNWFRDLAGSAVGLSAALGEALAGLPKLFGDAFATAMNAAIEQVEKGLNAIAGSIGKVPYLSRMLGGESGAVSIPRMAGGGGFGGYSVAVGGAYNQGKAGFLAPYLAADAANEIANAGIAFNNVDGGGYRLPTRGGGTSTTKGSGDDVRKRGDKLSLDTARDLEAANAYAEASERGARAVANLEIHFKALKSAQDVFGDTASKNAGQVAALTKKIEEQMQAAERAKSLKDFNLGTEELERTNTLLAAENGLINANVEDRARELALIKLKHEVQSKGLDATNPKEKEAIDRRGEAIAQNERLKAQGEELKKANELWTEPLKNALNSIQTTAADMFDSMLEKGAFSFQELGNFAQRLVRRMIAEFAALAVIRPMLGSLMGGLQGLGLVSPSTASSLGYGGGAGGAGGGFSMPGMGGGSGMFGFLNNPISPGSMPAGVYGPAQPGLGGLTWGQGIAGAASIGMGAYALATSKSTAGKIGGGLGMLGGGIGLASAAGLLPMLGAAGGPIGMGLGMAGMLLPMLFGGGESAPLPPLSGSNLRFDPSSGGYSMADTQQNGGRSMAGTHGYIGGTLDSLFGAIGGLTDPGKAFGASVWNNQREGTTSTYLISPTQGSNQQTYNESGDPAKAIDRLIAKVFYDSVQNNAAMKASPTLRTALGNKETTSVAQVQALISLVDSYDKLGKVTNSAKSALDEINAQFASLTAGANEYGLSLAPINAEQKKLTTRYAQDFIDGMLDPMAVQLRTLEDQRKDAIASAEYIRDNVKDVYVDMARIAEYWTKKERDLKEQAYAASVDSLQALIRRLTYGDLANASPDTSYAGTRGTYEATLAQARAGSTSALNNLSGFAEAYASSGRSYFASGPEYAALLEQMRRDLGEVAGITAAGGGSAANGNEATNAVLQSNAELRGMVGALLGELSGVKDQLAAATAEMKRRA